MSLAKVIHIYIIQFTLLPRKKRVSIQGSQDKSKISNSISQSKMNTEPKVVSTQTTISSTTVTAEVKPQQVQAQTPDHKMYVTEMRKELSEASTTTPSWSPGHNGGHLLVKTEWVHSSAPYLFVFIVSKDQDNYQSAANLTKFNTHINSTSMTLSNSELNNICPHGKGSTKSEYRKINRMQWGEGRRGGGGLVAEKGV